MARRTLIGSGPLHARREGDSRAALCGRNDIMQCINFADRERDVGCRHCLKALRRKLPAATEKP